METRTRRRSQQTEQAQLEQFLQDPQSELVPHEQDNQIGTSRNIGRKITKGVTVEKKRRSQDAKLEIVMHPKRKRIVGENAKLFKTEACVVLKQLAPLEYAHWKDIPTDDKKKMWLAMKQKFELQENFQTKKIVLEQLNRQYRNRRHKLHSYYLKHKHGDDILNQPPEGVKLSDWDGLINYFESDDFKKVSGRNIENRKNLEMGHTCGTKSIAQYCFEERNAETGEEPTRTDTWKKTRFSNKKNDWVDEKSRQVFEKITSLQNPEPGNHQVPLDEDEAFVKAIAPEKPNRLRGCGDGLKPPSYKGQRAIQELERENQELHKKIENDKERMEEMTQRIEVLESQARNQKTEMQAQFEAFLKTQVPAILQNLNATGPNAEPNV